MKRRLSVAMSTVGDVDILFLDEPTTGLDPISRRRVWEAINWIKENRVVVLTTHNMEEADLGNNIMIMHNGQVRAYGDPLFLKQTYGKGYQINLTVNKNHIQEAQDLIRQVLPTVSLESEETSGIISCTVPKGDIRGLPRLFSWLESSSQALNIVKEWGISNTTLEQVFLMLCVQNNTINYTETDFNTCKVDLCPMCQVNHREIVFMRDINGQVMIVPNSVCVPCSNSNFHYHINEEEVPLLEVFNDTNEKLQLLKKAQTKQESAISDNFLTNGNQEGVTSNIEYLIENEFNEELRLLQNEQIKIENSHNENENEKSNVHNHNDHHDFNPYENIITGSTSSQINALMVKNIRLQYRQKWSNCCSIFFVCFMFLMLYLLSLIFIGSAEIKQCPIGYLTDVGCDSSTLMQHIFSGSTSSMVNGVGK
jgi:ABC-type glutathione transport system ATPase component